MPTLSAQALHDFVQQISRTTSGALDVSTASDKDVLFGDNCDGDELRRSQRDALTSVAALHADYCADGALDDPDRWISFLVRTNELLVGPLPEGSRFRTFAPERDLPYIPARLVPRYTSALARHLASCERRLRRRAPNAEVTKLAAATLWAIDLRGHIFSDGCCRTALATCAFLLARHDVPLPVFDGRRAYYAAAYDDDGRLSHKRWSAYIHSRFPNGCVNEQ